MKRLLFGLTLFRASLFLAAAAPATIYVNNSPLFVPPQVDATAFLNRSIFDIATTQPFRAQNVQFWTNTATMRGTPGFLFEYNRDGKAGRGVKANSRDLDGPSQVFYNDGDITGFSVLGINAANVINSGRLSIGEAGRITILATNGVMDLGRSGISAATTLTAGGLFCGSLPFGTNYSSEANITDLYWGAGRNNNQGTNGVRLNLAQINAGGFLVPNFILPFPSTPAHQVIQRFTFSSLLFTNTITLPNTFSFFDRGLYDAFVHTNDMGGGDLSVNIVFVPTNTLLIQSNLSVAVRFAPDFGPAGFTYASIVEFQSYAFNIVEQQFTTNYVTFLDTSAGETNIVLARPFLTGIGAAPRTRRPATYNIVRGRYCSIDFTEPANAPYDPAMFYGPNFRTNIVNTLYAGYSAQIGATNSQAFTSSTVISGGQLLQRIGVNPAVSDPTNFAGRVDVSAGRINMNNTRIRAENFIGIKANGVLSNVIAQLDAPFINFDVQSTNADLVIQNLAPDSVSRLGGQISAWSSVWSVDVTNALGQVNNVRYSVLLLDNQLRTEVPVILHRFNARAPQLVIQDNLFVNASVGLNAPSICVENGSSLNLPIGSSWAFTNVQNLLNLTNRGSINVPGGLYLGTFDAGHSGPLNPKKRKQRKLPPLPAPLNHLLNLGAVSASAIFARATNAAVSGAPLAPAVLNANDGVIGITASEINLSHASLVAGSDVELHGNVLRMTDTAISAGKFTNATSTRGALLLDATNSFGDFGPASSNFWRVTSGVKIPRRPARSGDLMGTHIYSTAGVFAQSTMIWPGQDRGASDAGFVTNLALGKLTLDGLQGNLFYFQGAQPSNALYVDYLELVSGATNYSFALGVDPKFTIYFANANISPEKIELEGNGRIRWVSTFAGPNSSTSFVYPDGNTYVFNTALVRSSTLDSDGDGIENAADCTPVAVGPPSNWFGALCPAASPAGPGQAKAARAMGVVGEELDLAISLGQVGREVLLQWNAPEDSSSTVEFKDSLADGTWQTLTNLKQGATSGRAMVKDAVGLASRVYRVRVDVGRP